MIVVIAIVFITVTIATRLMLITVIIMIPVTPLRRLVGALVLALGPDLTQLNTDQSTGNMAMVMVMVGIH